MVKVVVPEASGRPAPTPSAPEKSFVRAPVSAPSHEGGLDKEAEFAAMKEQMEALELAEARRQAEFEALQADNRRLLGEVRGFLDACHLRA